ncbi:MAG TPA: alpha/beta hydrolase [Spirochaetota bacterium]|nr:alpha/beta hydrolase [Spirochaetota bacterium]HPI89422.1 alpha/beta hydrolase [Spirochaetota bacterium]HPR46910.1 alpha/beta hydrolase [Spirochaetota bacterium]
MLKKDGFIEISTGRVHYLQWGEGRQIHFLHANGFCAGVYHPFVSHLGEGFEITASDIRGHGDSAPCDCIPLKQWEPFARDLKEFVTRVMTPPVIGAGHSLGAVVTLMASVLYPELFSRIILIDPVILPPRLLRFISVMRFLGQQHRFPLARKARRRKILFQSRDEVFARFSNGRGLFKTWPEEYITAYLNCAVAENTDRSVALKCDPELEARIYESVPSGVWKYVSRVSCPVLAVRGENSDTFLPAAAEKMGRSGKNISVVTVPGAGHFIPMERPRELAAVMLEFINS